MARSAKLLKQNDYYAAIEGQNFPVSKSWGIWLSSLRQALLGINRFVHRCIENGTKPDTFPFKV